VPESEHRHRRRRRHQRQHESGADLDSGAGSVGRHGHRRRQCPFCLKRRAVKIKPRGVVELLLVLFGIRGYSCRACHVHHFAFTFIEGSHFGMREVFGAVMIVLVCIAGWYGLNFLLTYLPPPE
jgi:hypothetical protein